MIFLAIGAAICVTLGSLLRFIIRNPVRRLAAYPIYLGYILFTASIAIYIVLGFLSP
ncbi:MAG TPA: hypothetical protein VEL68_02430 [Thermodesulfobacteriota bacterium]|nr:hypothetical protein [Thermodesulfobacteriota bacterium]